MTKSSDSSDKISLRHKDNIENTKTYDEIVSINEKYRTIFENYSIAITLADKNERIISWNKYTEELFNMNETDLYKRSVKSLYPREEWNKIRKENIRKRGIKNRLETRMIKNNHEVFDVEISLCVLKGKNGEIAGSVGIIKDISDLKKTEKALKESEEKYRTIFENSAAAIMLADEKERIVSWNKYTEELLEVDSKNFYLKPVETLYPIDEWNEIRSKNIREKGLQHHMETKIYKNNNELIDIDLSLSVLKNHEGDIIGTIGVIQDISTRKNFEKNLQHSENKYHNLFDNAADMIILLDKKGKFIDVNKRFEEESGYIKDEIIGKNVFKSDLVTRKSLSKVSYNFFKLLMGKSIPIFEIEGINKDNILIPYEIRAVPLKKDNKIYAVQAILRNLTERKIFEKEKQEKQKEIEFINRINTAINLNSNLDEIYKLIRDETGKLFNTHGATIYILSKDKKNLIIKKSGYSDKQIRNIKKLTGIHILKEKIPLNQNNLYQDIMDQGSSRLLNDNKEIIQIAQDYTDKSTFKRFVPVLIKMFKINSVMISPLLVKNECIGLIIISRETPLTDNDLQRFTRIANQLSIAIKKIQTEKELEQLNNKLNEKVKERTKEVKNLLRQKDEFINQLGHDLKNPLTPLINLFPIIENAEKDPEMKEMLAVINRNVGYMNNLVSKTIELAKLNSTSIEFSFEEINLLSEMNKVIEKNKIFFVEKNIHVINNIPVDIQVSTDKLWLEELFNNLLTNSIKYSKNNDSITIDAKSDDNFITVSFSDTGIGMTSKQLSYVFNEFYKADTSRHDFDSTGLGLSICKRIVEHHSGRIWAESEGEGKGSTFYFTIPREEHIIEKQVDTKDKTIRKTGIQTISDKVDMIQEKNNMD